MAWAGGDEVLRCVVNFPSALLVKCTWFKAAEDAATRQQRWIQCRAAVAPLTPVLHPQSPAFSWQGSPGLSRSKELILLESTATEKWDHFSAGSVL